MADPSVASGSAMATAAAATRTPQTFSLSSASQLVNGTSTVASSSSAAPNALEAFQVICTGQIEAVEYPGVKNAYCRYSLTYGPDWRVEHGAEEGLSQMAFKGFTQRQILLNFPIDLALKSTNPFGWPRLVVSVYGLDSLGRDVILGYGSMLLPTCNGLFEQEIPLFRPMSSTILQNIIAVLTGSYPEYFDSKFITQNEGRQLTRVVSAGKVRVRCNVLTYGMERFAYSASSQSATTPSAFQARSA